MSEKEIINLLKNRFGAEREEPFLTDDEKRYLDERDKIEEIFSWEFDEFFKHYQLIKQYGLVEKLLEILALRIDRFMNRDDIERVKKTEFYQRFGDHSIIKRAINK